MQRKIKLIRWFVYEWGKPPRQKPHWVILRSLLSRIHCYHNKQLQAKGIPVPYTNIQLNIYPNTQLDLFCSENLSFSMHGFQDVANQLMHRSKYMTNHQLEKDVGCKVLQFISSSTQWRSRSSLVTKPYDIQTQQLLQEKDELEYMSLVTICLWKTFALSCISCDDS